MNLIDEQTPIVAPPNLEIFGRLPVQTSIEKTRTYKVTPFAQLNSGSNYEFKILSSANEFVPLNKIKLRVKMRVKLAKNDTAALAATDWDKVSMVNNVIHSLWSQVDVFLGDTPLTTSLQTYPYLAYLMTLFSTPKRQQDLAKVLAGYTDDNMSSTTKDLPNSVRSSLLKPDSAPFDTSKTIVLQDYLFADPFNIPLDLIGKTEMTVRLIQSKPDFFFIVNDSKLTPSVEFLELQLIVPKHRINGNVMAGIYSTMNNELVKYPYTRREVRCFTIENGTTSKHFDNLIMGQMPRKIYFAFANNQAVSGSVLKNPYYFGTYNLDYLQCSINGEPIRSEAYQPDFENGIYDEEYLEFLRITGNLNNNPQTTVTPSKWRYGYTIFAFDASPDQSDDTDKNGYLNLRQDGSLSLSMRFKQQLNETVNCIMFCEYDNQMSIDEFRNVYIDSV